VSHRDPYTGEPVNGQEPAVLAARFAAAPPDDGYRGTKPNPVYRGLPWARLRLDARGEIVAVDFVTPTDAMRRDRSRAIAARTRRT
jgi:hypothetical protein